MVAATIPHSQADNSALSSHPKIPHSPKPRNFWMRTESYSSHGIKYFRFRWGKGKSSFGYVHISGGACIDPLVQSRKKKVDEAIATGSLLEVLEVLRQFDNAAPGRKPSP